MTAYSLVSRRVLLRDMGRAGLAVIVFGAAACSSDSDEGGSSSTGGPTSTSPGGDPTTTRSEPTSTTRSEGTSTAPDRMAREWHRVNLGFVSAYVLYRDGEAALVDTGVAGSEDDIETGLSAVGLGWDAVGHLIVTHRHPDHRGSVDAVLTASGAPWYAGKGDLGAISAASRGTAVGDGDRVFDLTIIETPGHTPGHISVLDESAGVLVAGDALNGTNEGIAGPDPDFSEDMVAANASVARLAEFDYEVALFGHGDPVLSGASDRVATLAAGEGS